MKVIGNRRPLVGRYKPEEYWNRLTVDKCPPPHMTPARGKCKKLFDNRYK